MKKMNDTILENENPTSSTVREMKPSLLKASRTMGLKALRSFRVGGGKK